MKSQTTRFPTKSFTHTLSLFFILLTCFTGESVSQTAEQLTLYAEQIKFGVTDVKRNALSELRNFESESASRTALPALKDLSEIVRGTAIRSVIYLPKDESMRALLPLLNEKSEFIRRETALALGETKNPKAANKLISQMLTDKKQSVKDACAFALGKIGNVSAIQPLTSQLKKKPKKKRRFFRRTAARSIGQIAQTIQGQTPVLTTPESFLPDKYKEIVKSKHSDLAESFPVFLEANQVLISMMQNRKESDDTKREVAFALGEIGNTNSISILKANLNSKDNYLAEICKEALMKIKFTSGV